MEKKADKRKRKVIVYTNPYKTGIMKLRLVPHREANKTKRQAGRIKRG